MHAFSICVCIEGVGTQGRGKGEEGGGRERERELGGGMCFFYPHIFLHRLASVPSSALSMRLLVFSVGRRGYLFIKFSPFD